jgi:uncharacterized protein with PhoU and TrkA domain
VGKTLGEIDLRSTSGAHLVAIERQRDRSSDVIGPTKNTELLAGDILLVDLYAPRANADAFRRRFALEELPLTGAYFSDRSQEIGMAEAMVAPDSRLVGRTVTEARFRTRHRLTMLGMRRGRTALRQGHLQEPLRIGDTLLVVGRWKDIEAIRTNTADLVLLHLPAELDLVLPAPRRAPHALAVLALVVALMVSGVVPNVQAGPSEPC